MNRAQPLDRLLRAAACAPAPVLPPPSGRSEEAVLRAWRHPPFRPPPRTKVIAEEIAGRYRTELGLSAEQLERFRPIALEAATNMTQLHSDVMQRVGDQFRRTHEQMAAWLTAAQQERLRAFEERERRKFTGGEPPP